jgi:hypothetical protein
VNGEWGGPQIVTRRHARELAWDFQSHSQRRSLASADAWERMAALALALLALATGCGASPRAEPSSDARTPRPEQPLYPVHIRQPATLGVLDTSQESATGTPVGIACVTCHGAGVQAPLVERSGASSFHAGVQLKHADLPCAACHDPLDRTRLRLADGSQIEFGEVMRLCGQCHGPQLRDYQHGAHGGMRGYWDLSRGPRERNSCIVCHGPHQPAYPHVIPAPPPRDRFLTPRAPESGSPHEGEPGGQ